MLLKQMYGQSDEAFVDRWIENPYWPYFCGETYFQFDKPFDPSEFIYFRKRRGFVDNGNNSIIVGVMVFVGSPFDGHTFEP